MEVCQEKSACVKCCLMLGKLIAETIVMLKIAFGDIAVSFKMEKYQLKANSFQDAPQFHFLAEDSLESYGAQFKEFFLKICTRKWLKPKFSLASSQTNKRNINFRHTLSFKINSQRIRSPWIIIDDESWCKVAIKPLEGN